MANWIKVETNLFDNPKIQMLSNLPKGDSYVSFWIRLLCMAGKLNNGGYVYVAENAAYTPQLLAAITGKPVALVKTMLKTIQELRMIDVDTNGIIYIIGWDEHQNTVGLEKIREQTRERVKRYRDNKRNATSNATSNATATDSNSEVTQQNKNKNKNKNIDYYDDDNNTISYSSLEVDTKAIVNTTSLNTTTSLEEEVDSKSKNSNNNNNIYNNIYSLWEKNISPITPIIAEKITALVDEVGEEAIKHGIEAACVQNVRTVPYVASCARNYLGGLNNRKHKGSQDTTDLAAIAAMIDRRLEESDNGTDSSASFCGFWQP